jgi:O-antigen ligase
MKRWLLALTGLLLLLAPLKFSAPVVLQSLAVPPSSLIEWVFWAWPNQLCVMIAAVLVLLLAAKPQPSLLGVLPVLWLATQALAVPTAICRQTAVDTLLHFGACVAVFYAAARCAREPGWENWLLGALAAATLLVCCAALEQHFGGLDATRRYAAEHANLSEALRLKLTSQRVFGTFASPNSLAGFLAVAFVPVLAWLGSKTSKALVVVLAGGVMVACVALSGSRGGFAALAAGALVWLASWKCSRWWRWGLVMLLVVAVGIGLIHRGASSLEARLDYWGGAARIIGDYPWLGTGPGTFGSIYPKYKTALTEEAQLVHNNFLQMWSDSGVAAFVVFAALWGVGLWQAARRNNAPLLAALVAWTIHGLLDFDLYVPGIALPAFALLGVVHGLSHASQAPVGNWRWLCVPVVAAVLWFEGQMLAASFAYGGGDLPAATRWAPRNPHYWMASQSKEGCQKAVALDPMRSSRHVHLARAYWAAGEHALAVAELRQAVALNPTEQAYREELKTAEESVRQDRGSLLQSRPF